jgi:HPt (histidine-containing phosphotransfer) domain-containing protein
MDDVLTKPLRTEEFQKKVEQWSGGNGEMASSIDRAYLSEISGADPEFETELLQVYIATAPDLVEQLRRAVAAQDMDKAHTTAHTLKGSSRSIGASGFADLCQRLELAAREQNAATIAPTFKQLDHQFALLLAEARLICESTAT